MSANGISHLSTKQARQAAKLALAANTRAAGGNVHATAYRTLHTLDTTELPTVYTGNTVTAQSHVGGLIKGRPWK